MHEESKFWVIWQQRRQHTGKSTKLRFWLKILSWRQLSLTRRLWFGEKIGGVMLNANWNAKIKLRFFYFDWRQVPVFEPFFALRNSQITFFSTVLFQKAVKIILFV